MIDFEDYGAAVCAQNAKYYAKSRARALAPELVEALRGMLKERDTASQLSDACMDARALLARIEGGVE